MNEASNKQIWKWILQNKDIEELVSFSKKIKINVAGFREINKNVPRNILINCILKKVLSSKKVIDIEEDYSEEELNRDKISEEIKRDGTLITPILESLLMSQNLEKIAFANDIFNKFIIGEEDKKEIDGNQLGKSQGDLHSLQKEINLLQKRCEDYSDNIQKVENKHLKELKAKERELQIKEKKITNYLMDLRKKDDAIAKIKKDSEEEKKNLVSKIEELEAILAEKENVINELKKINIGVNHRILNPVENENTDIISKEIAIWTLDKSKFESQPSINTVSISNAELNNKEVVTEKLSNTRELWYIGYEITEFQVRKLRKLLRESNSEIKITEFCSVNNIKLELKRRS